MSPSAANPAAANSAAAASPVEAAAIAAAIERFLADTTPPPAPTPAGQDGWTVAAMLEGVSRSDQVDSRGPGAGPAHRWINT